jgi:NDP-sugar pyrophosphorylase family protein
MSPSADSLDVSKSCEGLTLVVMAAGLGRRYGTGNRRRLKQLEHVGPDGATLLDYTVYDALRAGFDKVVFVVREEIERDFHRETGHRIARQIDVAYAHQTLETGLDDPAMLPAGRTRPWGTGQAALAAAPLVSGPCSIVNADDFYGRESIATVARLLRSESPNQQHTKEARHFMVAYSVRDTLSEYGPVSRGFCATDEDDCLTGLVITPRLEPHGSDAVAIDDDGTRTLVPGDALSSMNLWGFEPSVFDLLKLEFNDFVRGLEHDPDPNAPELAEFGLPSALLRGVDLGLCRVSVHRASNRWFGITHPEDLARVQEQIARLIEGGVYPERLWHASRSAAS